MADTTPRLNAPSADARVDYSPLSWMATAAFAVAVTFALLLLCLGYFAFSERKPLIESWLFAFPVFGIVLAFAGWRHIVNSEGTRTGLIWAKLAWWICLVGGLGYFVHLRATEFTISNDTDRQFRAWADNLNAADLDAPNDPALSAAFYQTLPPTQRVAFNAGSTTVMQDRFGPDFVTFRQNKLLMIAQRNKGRCEFVPQGLKQWQYTPGKIECGLAATLRTPEGEFPLLVPLVATVGNVKREWQVAAFDGYVNDAPGTLRTPYGWLVEWLDGSAKIVADQFLQTAADRTLVEGGAEFMPDGLLAQPVAHDAFASGKFTKPVADAIVATAYERAKFAGALALVWPTSPAYVRGLQSDFFVQTPLPDGKLAPDASREDFLFCWNNIGSGKIAVAGRHLTNSTDKNSRLRFLDDRVEVWVPIELKVLRASGPNAAALGRLVMTLDDPKIIAELAEARGIGSNGEKSADFPKALQKTCPWKVTRLESNLKVIRAPSGGGGPGGQ